MKEQNLEEFIFELIDQSKFLFFPEQWNHTFMDYSKNEIFALFFVYRKGQANMTEIADYLNAPLNTVTGIISRLEKRGVIQRQRDVADKRVVTIGICEAGKEFIHEQLNELGHYFTFVMDALTEEEKTVLLKLFSKIFELLNQDRRKREPLQDNKKVVRKIEIE